MKGSTVEGAFGRKRVHARPDLNPTLLENIRHRLDHFACLVARHSAVSQTQRHLWMCGKSVADSQFLDLTVKLDCEINFDLWSTYAVPQTMIILRWIAFFIISLILLSLSNLGLIWLFSFSSWWIKLPGFFVFYALFLQSVPIWSVMISPIHRTGSIMFILIVLYTQTYLIFTTEPIIKSLVILLFIFGLSMIKKGHFIYLACSRYRKITGRELVIDERINALEILLGK